MIKCVAVKPQPVNKFTGSLKMLINKIHHIKSSVHSVLACIIICKSHRLILLFKSDVGTAASNPIYYKLYRNRKITKTILMKIVFSCLLLLIVRHWLRKYVFRAWNLLIHQYICFRIPHVTFKGSVNTSTHAVYYLSTSTAILSMTVTALLTSLSPIASEAPCSSAVFCRRLSVICSLQETTCIRDVCG